MSSPPSSGQTFGEQVEKPRLEDYLLNSILNYLPMALVEQIQEAGQSSVFRFWNELTADEQTGFASELAKVDWPEISRRRSSAAKTSPESLDRLLQACPPRHVVPRPTTLAARTQWKCAREQGEHLIRGGQVGVLLVAGGSGTRLGFPHPKGMFALSPVTGQSLFQLLAEQVVALAQRYETRIPYLIMTGETTHHEIVEFFARHNSFGLDPRDVFFFQQGNEPSLDAVTGEVLLSSKSSLALSPDGHGGVLAALKAAGLFDELRTRGVDTLFYHQVDNPLVHVCDPAFLGFHKRFGADVSTKVVCKEEPGEKVGLVVDIEGQVQIIEYSDLPSEMASARDVDGRLRLRAGNTAIHLFQVEFLERIAATETGLPFHRARRKVPYVDQLGQLIHPQTENGIKFERFVFDVLPFAQTALVVETDRALEFAPLKNATGDSSPADVQRSMSIVSAARLRAAGVDIPEGLPVEISPFVAAPDEDLTLRDQCPHRIDGPFAFGPEHVASKVANRLTEDTALHSTADTPTQPLLFSNKLMARVWGGRLLGELVGLTLPTAEPYGEVWSLSDLPDYSSRVIVGPHRGQTLSELCKRHGSALMGANACDRQCFPILIKWLECRERLSVQVHPDDEMARKTLGQPFGKSEVWVVLQAEPGAQIWAGLNAGISREDFQKHLQAGTVQDCLHSFTPQAGDCVVLPAGTVHAAGGGILIAEIQQTSDATFRLFDWNRCGLDGKPRALQVDLAMQAIDWNQGPVNPIREQETRLDTQPRTIDALARLPHFSLDRYVVRKTIPSPHQGEPTIWMVIDGVVTLTESKSGNSSRLRRGQTVLIPATSGPLSWSPDSTDSNATLLCIRLPRPA